MNQKTKAMFISYFEGKISQEDEMILIQWIKNHPDSFEECTELRLAWNMAALIGEPSNKWIEKEWNKLYSKIEEKKGNE